MKKKIAAALMALAAIAPITAAAESHNTNAPQADGEQKVVLVTVDGYRWQELFRGADSVLINTKKFGDVDMMKASYWKGNTAAERRRTLMPFTWDYIAQHGIILGDRDEGCQMDVTNKWWFSYPGYSENLCGHPDDEVVNTNEPLLNPNMTVFEVANNTEQYHGNVLAFGSWERFIEIFNEKRSGLEVNTKYRKAMSKNPTPREQYLDHLTDIMPHVWDDERFDFITHEYALEAMRSRHPKLMFIGYGETDEWGHEGNYRLYLDAAHYTDIFLHDLWELIQSDPFYRDQTTVIITCDHGRGDTTLDAWRDHGESTPNSGQTWMMALGKGIPAKGVLTKGHYYNNQIAPTIAKLLGVKFQPKHDGVGKPFSFIAK